MGLARFFITRKDIWPHFISCVLVVTEKLMPKRPEVVRDLVRGIAESGEWAEIHRTDAAKLVAPYFRQDEKVVYVLTQPPDRVSYRMLTPTDEDLQQIHDLALRVGILEKPISMKTSLWHPNNCAAALGSKERDAPRGKPVASLSFDTASNALPY
jgi:NitT/TauT family transport system substrate-binding protein